MDRRFKYILAFLLAIIVYETYLILLYAYRDYEIETYMTSIIAQNNELGKKIEQKREHLAYIHTNAYIDRVAKETQNRQNPGEEVIVLVSEEESRAGEEYDTLRHIVETPTEISPTTGMSHEEKWLYYLFRVR